MPSNSQKRRIAIVTSTRADWGLLSPLAHALTDRDDCELSIIATNMHLSQRYGLTLNNIIDEGFEPVCVAMDADSDSTQDRAKAMASCLHGMAEVFGRINPDMVVVLGDRYEMLAVSSAAVMMMIPIVHIAGGTISEGAIDDSIRHAITKLSALHLTETEEYRQRIIAMGEEPDRVIDTGAIGVWKINSIDKMSREELGKELDFDLTGQYAVATFHPATLDQGDPGEQCRAMLEALDRHPDIKLILTYPNNDPGSTAIIAAIEEYAAERPKRVKLVKSLGSLRYLSALEYATFSIGNSSSGIVEVASAGIPSIDIGIRQHGRASAESVIHCDATTESIDEAINKALTPEFKAFASKRENPYSRPDTLRLMVDAIMNTDISKLKHKSFYDIPR